MEKQRSFHPATRSTHVLLVDDLGAEHRIQAHVGVERCPMCQREYPQTAGKPDLEKLVAEVIASLDAEAETVIDQFEQHGMDKASVAAMRAKMHARRNQAGQGGGNSAPAASPQG